MIIKCSLCGRYILEIDAEILNGKLVCWDCYEFNMNQKNET